MDVLRLVGAAAAGAALMYALDPVTGRRRRARVRDQLVHAAHRTTDAVDTTSRDLTNRARGVVAELWGRMDRNDVDDERLTERVRERVRAVLGPGSAVGTDVASGCVTLSGAVLAEDCDRLVRRVRAVRGVKDIVNCLEVYAEPGNVPGLEGRRGRARGGQVLELWQERWPPTARFATGVAGALLVAAGVRRLNAVGFAMIAAGAGLLSRAALNEPLPNAGVLRAAR